jgi:hypothetical protein
MVLGSCFFLLVLRFARRVDSGSFLGGSCVSVRVGKFRFSGSAASVFDGSFSGGSGVFSMVLSPLGLFLSSRVASEVVLVVLVVLVIFFLGSGLLLLLAFPDWKNQEKINVRRVDKSLDF